MRRGWVPQPAGLGNQDPAIGDVSAAGDSARLSLQRSDMSIASAISPTPALQRSAMWYRRSNPGSIPLVDLAPAGRHVYRRATCLVTQAPAGRHVRRLGLMHDKLRKTQLSLQRSAMCIASGNLPRFLVFLFSEAPAGRHVYRQATCLATQAPAGRHVRRLGLMHDKLRKTQLSLQRSAMWRRYEYSHHRTGSTD